MIRREMLGKCQIGLSRRWFETGQIVADIGAGTGYFTVRLAKSEAAPKVYAVDIEPSMVSYLRERAGQERLNNVVAVQQPRTLRTCLKWWISS